MLLGLKPPLKLNASSNQTGFLFKKRFACINPQAGASDS